jgi:hypothetical protein
MVRVFDMDPKEIRKFFAAMFITVSMLAHQAKTNKVFSLKFLEQYVVMLSHIYIFPGIQFVIKCTLNSSRFFPDLFVLVMTMLIQQNEDVSLDNWIVWIV